jgi:peptide deformylase
VNLSPFSISAYSEHIHRHKRVLIKIEDRKERRIRSRKIGWEGAS